MIVSYLPLSITPRPIFSQFCRKLISGCRSPGKRKYFRGVDQNALFTSKRISSTPPLKKRCDAHIFRFRAQLSFVVFAIHSPKGIRQRRWWVGNGGFDIGGVFGQHHEVQINHLLTRSRRNRINESAGNFARAVARKFMKSACRRLPIAASSGPRRG